jgi:hypothetical protein
MGWAMVPPDDELWKNPIIRQPWPFTMELLKVQNYWGCISARIFKDNLLRSAQTEIVRYPKWQPLV